LLALGREAIEEQGKIDLLVVAAPANERL